jgi:hypothetical protein
MQDLDHVPGREHLGTADMWHTADFSLMRQIGYEPPIYRTYDNLVVSLTLLCRTHFYL